MSNLIERVIVLALDVYVCGAIINAFIETLKDSPYLELFVQTLMVVGLYGIYLYFRR